MAFKFEYTGKVSDGNGWDITSSKRVTIELDDDDVTVPELLEEFMNFMKAVGYNFQLGDHLDVVNDFDDFKNEIEQEEQEKAQEVVVPPPVKLDPY